MSVTKGELENEISKRLTQWEKQYMGKGSLKVKTDILRNMVIVTLKGTLTPAEQKLAETNEGKRAVKRIRTDLLESGKAELGQIIWELTGLKTVSFHNDLSTKTGERLMVFVLSDNLEKKLGA